MSTVTVNIAFQDTLLRDIDRVARGESRSRSDFLREAARAYIQRKERWDGLFDLGKNVAAQKGLKEKDVALEIAEYRKRKAAGR